MTSVIMGLVKHSFNKKVKHELLARRAETSDHKAMLNDENKEAERMAMAARLGEAIKAAPSKTAVANACEVSDQAVTGWLKTGRIHKKNLPIIARETGYSLQWLMDGTGPKMAEQAAERLDDRETVQHALEIVLSAHPPEIRNQVKALLEYSKDLTSSQVGELVHRAEDAKLRNEEVIAQVLARRA